MSDPARTWSRAFQAEAGTYFIVFSICFCQSISVDKCFVIFYVNLSILLFISPLKLLGDGLFAFFGCILKRDSDSWMTVYMGCNKSTIALILNKTVFWWRGLCQLLIEYSIHIPVYMLQSIVRLMTYETHAYPMSYIRYSHFISWYPCLSKYLTWH